MKKKNISRFQVGSLTDEESMAIVRAKQKMMRAIHHEEQPTDKALLMCVVGHYNKEAK